MSTTPSAGEGHPVVVVHHSSCEGECRWCHHPISLYAEVGWVDRTPAYYGGSYDMCSGSASGQHDPAGEPTDPPRVRVHI